MSLKALLLKQIIEIQSVEDALVMVYGDDLKMGILQNLEKARQKLEGIYGVMQE